MIVGQLSLFDYLNVTESCNLLVNQVALKHVTKSVFVEQDNCFINFLTTKNDKHLISPTKSPLNHTLRLEK